jgi:fructose-1,6-bisphosphatase/inositol monophosphatase family enzyme
VTGPDALLDAIRAMHRRIREAVVDACLRQDAGRLARATAGPPGGGDTIYAIDRVAEEAMLGALGELPRGEPLLVLAEGLAGGSLVLPQGARENDCRWRMLVDPIDGTRGLMYQKRSAWILSGIAPNRGPQTRLRDAVLAVQTEIPLVKQHLSDQLWAVRGRGWEARRFDRLSGTEQPLALRPSSAATLAQGFASIARFFPGARDVLAAIDDEIIQALVPLTPGTAACFEDQYASSGGQLYELIAGHDRFVADLRPLVLKPPRPLCCHPYDLSAALVAEEAGVILSDPSGAPLDAPFDLTADVAWVGYANDALRTSIEPLLQAALRRRGLPLTVPSS